MNLAAFFIKGLFLNFIKDLARHRKEDVSGLYRYTRSNHQITLLPEVSKLISYIYKCRLTHVYLQCYVLIRTTIFAGSHHIIATPHIHGKHRHLQFSMNGDSY